MRFSYIESMSNPANFPALARAVEEAGYDSFAVPESICYPEVSDSTYPYTPDGNRNFLEDKPFIEPFCLVAALGAVTTRLRFITFVVKLGVREPVLAAKTATSLGVLTDNRFRFGVGLSPWPEDFAICNQPWQGRGRRLDEMIDIIRGLGSGDFFAYKGEFYDLPSIKMCPVPTEPVPILIGGHADPALKRAARVGDGWIHAGGDPTELAKMITRVKELLREYGREKEPFDILAASPDGFTLDGIKRLQDLGVTDLLVGFRDTYALAQDTETLQDKLDAINMFADGVIQKV